MKSSPPSKILFIFPLLLPLREQLHIFSQYFIISPFILEHQRLFFSQQIFLKRPLFSAKSGKRESGRKNNPRLFLCFPVMYLLRDYRYCKQIIGSFQTQLIFLLKAI